MIISVVQPDLIWEDKSSNLYNLEKMVSPMSGNTDLIILPEMFNTGFSMQVGKLAERPDGETYEWMMSMAEKGNFGICGSYIVKEADKVFNRWVFVSPLKESWYYDKRHPFSISGEDKFINKGIKRLVFLFRGVRISPYICYDLRFPVWSRNKKDTDLMIYASNWPASRKNVWNVLLRARAIENQCYVAGSNRIGTDGEGINYSGDSMIIDPKGDILTSAVAGREQIISAEISIDELNEFRRKFPVQNDADHFTINF